MTTGAQASVGMRGSKIQDFSAHLADKTRHIEYEYEGKRFLINNPYHGGSLHLKGQMHGHTTNSDGVDSPAAFVTAYKNAGYGFITITDHNTLTDDPGVAGITWLGKSVEETHSRHIVAYAVDERYTGSNVQDIINFHNANNKLTSIAHPPWSGGFIPLDEITKYYGYNFIEIQNLSGITYNAGEYIDKVLSKGVKAFILAVDDCHDVAGAAFNKGWVVVHCNENTAESILSSLRSGNFYASTGNDITISVENNVITASSSSSSNFVFIGKDGKWLQQNDGVTSATYTIKGDEMYVRVQSYRVSDGNYAWSQPIFVDCIGDDGKNINEIDRTGHMTEFCKRANIDGNFQIAQAVPVQGTEITAASGYPVFDMYNVISSADGGTVPQIKHSQALISPVGAIPDARYCYKMVCTNIGDSLGANSYYAIRTFIERGVRLLCGSNKKLTVSFWAKSDTAGKRIGVQCMQNYGSGGSPTPQEYLTGTNFTLTNYWKKYTHTFDTNTLAGKTFGTADDDHLICTLYLQWGAGLASRYSASTAENFTLNDEILIGQVQINVGDTALPFYPISYEEELRRCKRYYQRIGGVAQQGITMGLFVTTSEFQGGPVVFDEMRKVPTVTSTGAAGFKIRNGASAYTLDTINFAAQSKRSINIINAVVNSAPFTIGQAGLLRSEGTPNGEIILDARW
jgi:hypothetical protein